MTFIKANPLCRPSLLKLVARISRSCAATGILPWRIDQEGAAAAPHALLVLRSSRESRVLTKWLFRINVGYSVLICAVTVILVFNGVLILKWGLTRQILSLFTLGLVVVPFIAETLLASFDGECLIRECLKHVHFVAQFLTHHRAPQQPPPKLIHRSEMALKAIVFLVYENTLMVAVASVLIPWLPLSLSNVAEIAFRVTIPYPWNLGAKLLDVFAIMSAGHQITAGTLQGLLTLHCFNVCSTLVLRDLTSNGSSSSMDSVFDRKQHVIIIRVWRRIALLNICVNSSIGTAFFLAENAAIVVASAGAFAAIKIEGMIGIGLGTIAMFAVLILITLLEYFSLLGETMVKVKGQLERNCRGDALLRRQVRSLKPAFITAGSFYYIDKGCILTCCAIVVDNVVSALMLARK